MRKVVSSLAVLSALALPLAAHADTYTYDLTLSDSYVTYEGTYTSPDLLTSTTTLNTVSCSVLSCTASLEPSYDYIFVDSVVSSTLSDYYGATVPSSFFTVGTTNTLGDLTLTITDTPDVAATPEPSSLALLGTGVLGAAGVVRRRIAG